LIYNNLITNFFHSYGKVLALIGTMLVGALVPQASVLSFLVQYLLMIMLFHAFLDLDINPRSFRINMVWVLLANLAVAFAAYFVFSWIDHQLALAAFITAIAPTAISSTVIVSFTRGRVDFMVAAVLLTNVCIALVIPIVLPHLLTAQTSISTWDVLRPVLFTMFAPLILARLVTRLPQSAQTVIHHSRRFTFSIWLANLFIISAKASAFILSENPESQSLLIQIALIALLICIVNFALGALLGGSLYWQETSQALGQKNNSFAIWIALTFINPLVAMGPTFYVLYHNLYNTWQIYRFEQRNRKSEVIQAENLP
jgi:BASS family bile acid:Na+ symporter